MTLLAGGLAVLLTACAPSGGEEPDPSSAPPESSAPEASAEPTGPILLDEPAPAGLTWVLDPGEGWTESTFDPAISIEYQHANGCYFVTQDHESDATTFDPDSDRPGSEAKLDELNATLAGSPVVTLESWTPAGTVVVPVDGDRPIEFLITDAVGTLQDGSRWVTRHYTRSVSADATEMLASVQCQVAVLDAQPGFADAELAKLKLAVG